MGLPSQQPPIKHKPQSQIMVAVNQIILKDNKVLMAKRLKKSAYGYNHWALPGAHVEYGENPEQAALRGLYEETGIPLKKPKFLHFINDVTDKYHYVHFNFIAQNLKQKPVNKVPTKCAGWEYFDLNNIPVKTFHSHKLFINAYVKNQIYMDSKTTI